MKYFELLEVDALAVSLGRVVVVVVVVCVEVAPGGGAGGVVPGVVDCASTGNANRAEAQQLCRATAEAPRPTPPLHLYPSYEDRLTDVH